MPQSIYLKEVPCESASPWKVYLLTDIHHPSVKVHVSGVKWISSSCLTCSLANTHIVISYAAQNLGSKLILPALWLHWMSMQTERRQIMWTCHFSVNNKLCRNLGHITVIHRLVTQMLSYSLRGCSHTSGHFVLAMCYLFSNVYSVTKEVLTLEMIFANINRILSLEAHRG